MLLDVEQEVGITLTFFEAATFMAFCHFRAAAVDAMVLEVGMGGRLDATNVVMPEVSVIASIGLDHEEFLGSGEAAIAREKAGIARPGRPLAVGAVSDEAWNAIREQAPDAVMMGLTRGAQWDGDRLAYQGATVSGIKPALQGAHQQHNAALFALSALTTRGGPLELSDAALLAGFAAQWPGRYQHCSYRGMDVVLDGAHNPPAYEALRQTLSADTSLARPRVLIFGATEGRAHAPGLAALRPLFDHVILCPPDSPRAVPVAALVAVVPGAIPVANVAQAFAQLQRLGARSACVTGSLYLVGAALAYVQGAVRDAVQDFR